MHPKSTGAYTSGIQAVIRASRATTPTPGRIQEGDAIIYTIGLLESRIGGSILYFMRYTIKYTILDYTIAYYTTRVHNWGIYFLDPVRGL